MTDTPKRHPFLDDLHADVVLTTSVLRGPVAGLDQVTRVVKAGGSLYLRQTPTFLGSVEDRGLFEYEVDLAGDESASGLVSFRRDEQGAVTHLHIAFSPLGAVLSIASAMREKLDGVVDETLFL